jgi:adenylate cyclase
MKAITHFEVYLVKLGRWALHSRLGATEEDRAIELARSLEIDSGRATQVIEETLDLESGELNIRVVVPPKNASEIKPPDTGTNIASRLFMVALNSVGVGLIFAVIVAVGISQGRDRVAFPATTYNLLLFFAFAASALSAGLVLFRMYVPMDVIMWRTKSAESQQRTSEALIHGVKESPLSSFYRSAPLPSAMEAPDVDEPPAVFATEPAAHATPAVKLETNADQGEQTSFQLSAVDTSAPATARDSAADLMASLLAPHVGPLLQFADAANAALLAVRPQLQAFERYGFNLYLAGAALVVADKAQFDGDLKHRLLQIVIAHAGTNPETAQSFVARIDAAAERPRYRALMDAGRAAFEAASPEAHAPLPGLIQQWSDPAARGKAERAIFLLTDLVGSTALTSKLGNSGAQRVVRAHNSIVRQAIKDFKGKEIKHTGDGIQVTFTDVLNAARAAIFIQQEALSYTQENPDAPVSLRVGLHAGEASLEDGEYYGEAVMLLDGICAAADAGQISATDAIKSRCPASMFRFADMGLRTLKGSEAQQQIFLLEWVPKMKAPGQLEYRQIGTKPQPAN